MQVFCFIWPLFSNVLRLLINSIMYYKSRLVKFSENNKTLVKTTILSGVRIHDEEDTPQYIWTALISWLNKKSQKVTRTDSRASTHRRLRLAHWWIFYQCHSKKQKMSFVQVATSFHQSSRNTAPSSLPDSCVCPLDLAPTINIKQNWTLKSEQKVLYILMIAFFRFWAHSKVCYWTLLVTKSSEKQYQLCEDDTAPHQCSRLRPPMGTSYFGSPCRHNLLYSYQIGQT